MRHLRSLRVLCGGVAVAGLAACSMPRHQDAVFFGTDTKIAFDVGVQPENGNTPSITLGYKRREFVYMPLAEYGPAPQTGVIESVLVGDWLRNNTDAAASQLSELERSERGRTPLPTGTHHKYQGSGEDGKQTDSYSVFATFGGNFGGSAGGQGTEATARIKQVFATGIAAQIAAAKGEDYVNPAASNAKIEAAKAEARAAAAEARFSATGIDVKQCLRSAIFALPDDLAKSKAINLLPSLQDSRGASAVQNVEVPNEVENDAGRARQYLRDYMWASDPERYSAWNTDLGADCI